MANEESGNLTVERFLTRVFNSIPFLGLRPQTTQGNGPHTGAKRDNIFTCVKNDGCKFPAFRKMFPVG
ncbi:hypothetical protein BSZ32_06255 [Rubritalea profundi]|uniref:Uncharacterized protein n=1 Tax=Rubritalea profundi TaxID=1658618 RepID=A0A2S7U1D5_9BACT|nr:hypothetical protein BSZ32_06255 [Rubritalea profundi]